MQQARHRARTVEKKGEDGETACSEYAEKRSVEEVVLQVGHEEQEAEKAPNDLSLLLGGESAFRNFGVFRKFTLR